MTEPVAIDTDVLLKAAAYRLGADLVQVLVPKGPPAALGLTHLIAAKQLQRKRKKLHNLDGAHAELEALLATCQQLEPDETEIALAAALADLALDQDLPLDPGEAQIAAIVANRSLPLMLTGDKRALAALAKLMAASPGRDQFVARLACFEQAVASIAAQIGEMELRSRVCAEPEMDGGMRLACSCDLPVWDPAQLGEACDSFIGAVRKDVGDLLVAGSTLA